VPPMPKTLHSSHKAEWSRIEPVTDRMQSNGVILVHHMIEAPMYDQQEHDHSTDKAYVLCFRKT
jgi:hypothetical protein